VKKLYAVALATAVALPAAGVPAAAQDETITVEGVVFLDHDRNEAYTAGEAVRANGPGVRVLNADTNEKVGEFRTGADGRYRAVLPKGPRYLVTNLDSAGFGAPRWSRLAGENATLDWPLWGHLIEGFSFVDTNGDGAKQPGEKLHGGKVKVDGAEVEVREDGSYRVELPRGEHTVTAPNLMAQGLTLAKPLSAQDIDWVTGQTKLGEADRSRVDLRYVTAKADIAVEPSIDQPKDAYPVGEPVGAKVKLINLGTVPVAPSFRMNLWHADLIRHSDNVKPVADGEFLATRKILPGETVVVSLTFAPKSVRHGAVWPQAANSFDGVPDADITNNGVRIRMNVVENITTPPSPTTTTTAPTTTTTQPAVAKAGNKSGLASTGAAPLGGIVLGGLLLVAGAGAFFVARRRRS
jgi:LPXTG-motif cell wall-anchored protein